METAQRNLCRFSSYKKHAVCVYSCKNVLKYRNYSRKNVLNAIKNCNYVKEMVLRIKFNQ